MTPRRGGPGGRIGSTILWRSRRDPKIAAFFSWRRHNAPIVPAIDERESDFGAGQGVNLEHRAPRRDVVTLGADDENGQSNVLQSDWAAAEFEAAFGEIVVQKERAQILSVHPVRHAGGVRRPSGDVVGLVWLAHQIVVDDARPDEIVRAHHMEGAGHLARFENALLEHDVFEQCQLAVVDEQSEFARLREIRLRGEQCQGLEAVVVVALHAGRCDRRQRAADAIADEMRPLGAGDRERRADRRHEALAPIVVEAEVAIAGGRIPPRDAEDRESAVDKMPNQRVLRLQIEDIVFHDPRRRDDDRLRVHGFGGGTVLDDLSEVGARDDGALGQGDGLARLERFGRLAALVTQQALQIGQKM